MGRTVQPGEQEVRKSRRTADTNNTQCYWKCPCGGTVPNSPEHCFYGKRKGSVPFECTDSIVCVMLCGDHKECEPYQEFKKKLAERKFDDTLAHERKEKVGNL